MWVFSAENEKEATFMSKLQNEAYIKSESSSTGVFHHLKSVILRAISHDFENLLHLRTLERTCFIAQRGICWSWANWDKAFCNFLLWQVADHCGVLKNIIHLYFVKSYLNMTGTPYTFIVITRYCVGEKWEDERARQHLQSKIEQNTIKYNRTISDQLPLPFAVTVTSSKVCFFSSKVKYAKLQTK